MHRHKVNHSVSCYNLRFLWIETWAPCGDARNVKTFFCPTTASGHSDKYLGETCITL